MVGIKKGMLKGFLELDEKLRKIPEVASGEDKSGTTAVGALITDKYLIIANCGDSRGVACTHGKPVLATQFDTRLSLNMVSMSVFRTINLPMNQREKGYRMLEGQS